MSGKKTPARPAGGAVRHAPRGAEARRTGQQVDQYDGERRREDRQRRSSSPRAADSSRGETGGYELTLGLPKSREHHKKRTNPGSARGTAERATWRKITVEESGLRPGGGERSGNHVNGQLLTRLSRAAWRYALHAMAEHMVDR